MLGPGLRVFGGLAFLFGAKIERRRGLRRASVVK
jgi:hypothetical protein